MDGQLSKSTFFWMLATAIILDIISFALTLFAVGVVINRIIFVFGIFGFYLWFKIHGISFNSPKRMLSLGGSALVEFLPLVDILPAYTFLVVRVGGRQYLPKALGGTGGQRSTSGEGDDDSDDQSGPIAKIGPRQAEQRRIPRKAA